LQKETVVGLRNIVVADMHTEWNELSKQIKIWWSLN